ncbi:hypothetical protein H0H92_010157, partial [Tricholoma furcatifolium]
MEARPDLVANLPTFDGGEDSGKENPRAFIAKIKRTFLLSGLTNEQKVAVFELSLVEGGPAQEWFTGLEDAEKASWESLAAAFDARWPARAIVAKTTAEKQDDLRQHKLGEKDLLQKRELTDGREAYSHISFTDAVKNVKITKLREKIKRKEDEDALRRKVESLENAARAPQTPSKLLANTLSKFRLTTPVPQPNFGAPRQTPRSSAPYKGRTDQEKWDIISRLPDPPADTPANRVT